MKKINLVLTAILFSVGVSAFAQRGGGDHQKMDPAERVEKRTEKMKTELNLNEQQYKDLLALNTAQSGKMQAERKAHQEEMKAKREAMKAEHEAYEAKLKTILTPDQYAKHQADMETRKAEMKAKRGKHRGKRGGDWNKKG